jgi:hypothetical protein
MKIRKLFALLLFAAFAQGIVAQAQNLYQLNLRGSCAQINSRDRLAFQPFNTTTILRDYAATQDPAPNVRDLRLAYDADFDRIVIATTNLQTLKILHGFAFSTGVTNGAQTKQRRLVFVFPPEVLVANGTAILTETIIRDGEGNVTRRALVGSMQYHEPATLETPAVPCTATFSIGKKLKMPSPPAPVPVR